MSWLWVFHSRQKRGSSYCIKAAEWNVHSILPITVCLPLWFQLDLDPPSSSTHPGSSHKSSEISAWEVAPAPANGLETTTSGASGRGGGAWGIAGGRGQKIGGVQGANGSWGNGGAGLGTPASGAKTTVLEEALAALFRGEAVTGVKGRQNMEVGGYAVPREKRCTGTLFYYLSVQYESRP